MATRHHNAKDVNSSGQRRFKERSHVVCDYPHSRLAVSYSRLYERALGMQLRSIAYGKKFYLIKPLGEFD